MQRCPYFLLFCLFIVSACVRASGAEPLHVQIDRLISTKAGDATLSTRAGDEGFLRRVYLDLAGRIPTVEETQSFLRKKGANNRAALVDRLLAGPDYPRRMQELFHAILIERRSENEHWTKFLRAAFEANRPWDKMVQAILKPDLEDKTQQGASFFLTSRLVKEGAMAPVDVPGLTRDVGRLLAGIDLQCAQCHDHVTVDDYHQRDFQGLHMVFENIATRRDVEFPAVSENLLSKKKDFLSVFTQIPMQTEPVVPGGLEIAIPTFAKGEEYLVPPDRKKRTPGVLKFSPLGELAKGLASGENELFRKNIANRLWFMMMGRGLVEPLDLIHTDNPPSHPELLNLLASEFAAHKFDIKWLLRELALSETYQQTSVLPEGSEPPDPRAFLLATEKRLSAEQLFWSTLVATGELDRQRMLKSKQTRKEGKPRNEINAALTMLAETFVSESTELKEMRERFVRAFANPPKVPAGKFEPTLKAALFLMHDDRVLASIAPQPGNRVDRLSKLSDSDEIAEQLFIGVLNRRPTDEDRASVVQYLEKNKDRQAEAIGHLAWAMLASTEFCLNH